MGKISILFNVTPNISASHTGSNLLYPCVCSDSILLTVVLWNSAKIMPRQHNFVFQSVTSPFILGPRLYVYNLYTLIYLVSSHVLLGRCHQYRDVATLVPQAGPGISQYFCQQPHLPAQLQTISATTDYIWPDKRQCEGSQNASIWFLQFYKGIIGKWPFYGHFPIIPL